MEPKIIESNELIFSGCLVKYENGYDGGNEWAKWEELDAKGEAGDAKYTHSQEVNTHKAFSIWYNDDKKPCVFTGLEVAAEANDTAWEYLKLPPATYAVFDLDYNIDQDSQYEAIDNWLEENKEKYKRIKDDAGGRVTPMEFAVYIYDHDGKFKEHNIVEMMIPLAKVK